MTFIHNTKLFLADALSTIAPSTCEICGCSLTSSEHWICLNCNFSIPRTNIHNQPANRITDRLLRYYPDCRLASWFFYRRNGKYAELIHRIKYSDRPSMGRYFGEMFARELLPTHFFDGIDIILPVPIHWTKLLMRGYNQSQQIAIGVNRVTNIPIGNNLRATHKHATQTRRSQSERMANVLHNLFGISNPDALIGKRILLIDDVITTGSTIEACVATIHKAAPSVAGIDILSLGMTEND